MAINSVQDAAEALAEQSLSQTTGDIEHARVTTANSGGGMLNDFVANLTFGGGFAVQNRYQILIPTSLLAQNSSNIYSLVQANSATAGLSADWMGSGDAGYYGGDMRNTAIELTAFCDKTQLPGYQFQLETVRHYGPSFKIPHMPEYQDITMQFMCSNSMWERYFFDAWMYMVMDPVTNNFNYKSEYAVPISITSYIAGGGINDSDINYYTQLIDAFPVSITEQELGYDMNNVIQKLQVTFSYKFAVPYTGKTSTTGTPLRGQKATFQQGIAIAPAPPPQQQPQPPNQ